MANAVTMELLRRRTEHHNDSFEELEEISLHQQNLENIGLIGRKCTNLRILLLQGNLIRQIGILAIANYHKPIDDLSRLKHLQYLNLAINNIEKITNLKGCEMLTKLDLSLNFISQLTLLTRELCYNRHLREL